MNYSQNKEDLFIADYFGSFKGTLLEVGANDGLTFSNSRLLIEKGWNAHLVEPSSVFTDLEKLYKGNPNVQTYPLAIGETLGTMPFYESGAHVKHGKDKALVSSLIPSETTKWAEAGVKFEERKVSVFPFNAFWELTNFSKFDFISLDTEGLDLLILKQIDLHVVDCKCLCIEWNGNLELREQFIFICEKFRLNLAYQNPENLIFIK